MKFFHNNILITPVEQSPKLIKLYHERPSGARHRRRYETLARLANDYYWKGMAREVEHFIKHCEKCAEEKLVRNKIKLPLNITDTPYSGMEKISMDVLGPLPRTLNDNKYILTIRCLLTKFVVAAPLQNATATETARAPVDNFICIYGAPVSLLSDLGSNFMFCQFFRFRQFSRYIQNKTISQHGL